AAYLKTPSSEELYLQNLKAIQDHLTQKHGFPLTADDLNGIEYVYNNFYRFGPEINYNSSSGGGGFGGGGNRVDYSELMTATDEKGEARSFLATEENFQFMKDLESRNLLIPVVGNFAGPKAIRAVGKFIKDMNATVSAFYLSNVEDYLQDSLWTDFCSNAATLPLDDTSTFIRSARNGNCGGGRGGLNSDLGNMLTDLRPCMSATR